VDVRELAFGALRQVEIARALMLRPRLILFDEPTAGMTGTEVGRVGELLRGLVGDPDHPVAMLLIEHNVPFVFDLCDEITALHQGRVLTSGKPQDVRAHAGLVSAYLGSDAPDEVINADAIDVAPAAPAPAGAPALRLAGVSAGYGKADVLREVDLSVATGELAAIFGANGAGKTTMFHAVMGLLSRVRGEITAGEHRLRGMAPNRIVRAGVGFVPQDPHLLYQLTVEDNLRLAAGGIAGGRAEMGRRINGVYELFESLGRLRGAHAAQLSGGERRMLSIGKALVRAPEVLILDEPSIGLAPATVDAMGTAIRDLNRSGLTVLVAEQNARWLLPIATRKYVLERGSLHELRADDGDTATEIDLVERYLGVALTAASASDIEQIEG
jgi:ABC-type branched-subunit amino acid transport system ATPase component